MLLLALLTGPASANTVAVTEFLNNVAGDEDLDEWVEIYNFGEAPVDLTSWTLQDEDGEVVPLPDRLLLPRAFLVLAGDADAFVANWGVGTPGVDVVNATDLTLSNTTDELMLADDRGVVRWSLAYADDEDEGYATHLYGYRFDDRLYGNKSSPGVDRSGPDPAAAPGVAGYDSGLATVDGFAWEAVSGDVGSPLTGMYRDWRPSLAEVAITEFLHSSANVDPDYGGDWVELYNYGGAVADLTGWTLRTGTDDEATYTLPTATLDPGGYLVVTADPDAFVATWGVGVAGESVMGDETVPALEGAAALELRDAGGFVVASAGWDDRGLPVTGYATRFVEPTITEATWGELGWPIIDPELPEPTGEAWVSGLFSPDPDGFGGGLDVGSPLAGPYEVVLSGPGLTITGACPGRMAMELSGLTPLGEYALVTGATLGGVPLPGGPCGGTNSGLGSALALRATPKADDDGNDVRTPAVPLDVCGSFLVAVDLTTCAISAPTEL